MITPREVEILIVEDSAMQAKILQRKLVQVGYQVAVAGNGARALTIIRQAKPSLIISDIVMPVMDGYELCHQIKADDELRDIPVILLTGLSDPKDIMRGLEAKADSYVTKPWDGKLLLARIESILSGAIDCREEERTGALDLTYGGETYRITSGRWEIVNLLISTYENAVQQNRELVKAQYSLQALNQELEIKLHQLQETDQCLSVLVQVIPDIVYRLDQNGRFTFINDAIRQLGLKPEELIGKHFSEIILPEDVAAVSRDQVLPRYQGKVTGPDGAPKLFDERRTGARVTKDLEIRLMSKGQAEVNPPVMEASGKDVVIVEVNSSGMYGVAPGSKDEELSGSGGPVARQPLGPKYIGSAGTIRNITDRKLAECALHQSEERFRLLVQTADNPIVLLSPDYLILEWNSEAEQVYGKTRDEVLGQNFLSLLESSEADRVAARIKKVLAGIHEKDLETAIKHQDGSVRSLLWNFNCLLGEEQQPLGIIAVAQDITEWKRAEEERVNSLAMAEISRLSARIATETIEGMIDAVLIISPAGRIINCNQGFKESFGWNREVLGEPLANYVVGFEVHQVLEEIIQGQPGTNHLKNIDCQIIARDQKKVPVLVNATLLKDAEGNLSKIIVVIRDITERKEYEESIKRYNSEITALYEIYSTIAVSMNVEEMFDKLVNTISELEMFNVCKPESLFMLEDGRMTLVPYHQYSQEFVELHRGMQVGDCLCGMAAQTGEIIISTDCSQDDRHTLRCQDNGCHGHIVLPLVVKDEVKGVLSFICKDHFTMDENMEKILRTIGGQIGIALVNVALHEKTKALSLSDPLTGIANRRLLDIMLDTCLARTNRYGDPLALAMADIDHFKAFNDTYGHVEGDKLLSQIAGLISGEIRQTDLVARYGGEEFLIMLPDSNLENAWLTGERIRRKIAEHTGVTISIGVAAYHQGMNKEDLIDRADQAMYQAKQNGRNQVQVME
jgi:diguanylate cyclase (GGDEF)-like protein/PAS domain S-box-containing protein